MNLSDVVIGLEVVRSKGDYVVGNVGKIEAIDLEKGRVQVGWNTSHCKTWVKVEVIEPTTISYKITEYSYNKKSGRHSHPKYIKI